MALSANRDVTLKNTKSMTNDSWLVVTSVVVYKGALLVVADAGAGVIIPADTTTTRFVGMAAAAVATGDGTVEAEVINNVWALLPTTGLTAGDVGAQVYCTDDSAVQLANTVGPSCGVYKQYSSAGFAWIALGDTALAKAS